MATDTNSARIYIGDVAEYLDRRVGTVRKWHRDGRLPEGLHPERDERNRRYWTNSQVEEIKQWMIREDMRPGKGLPTNQDPNPEQVAEHLRKLRQPRGISRANVI